MPNKKYVVPKYGKSAFHCPHCDAFAHQHWGDILMVNIRVSESKRYEEVPHTSYSKCSCCKKHSIWTIGRMVFPNFSTAPIPADDMPENVKEIYNEARSISDGSPRAACGLLRLAVQLLVKHLGEDESNLNKAIGNLVKKGLPKTVQMALDSVRITGNHTLHPGAIDLNEKPEIASILFGIINFIVEKMITDNKKIDEFYKFLPEKDKSAVDKRDSKLSSDDGLAH